MLPWSSKKIVKSVTFNPEIADESLLAVVETELEKQPHKTFSDLCKEALWQFLCVPESVRPSPQATTKEQSELPPAVDLQQQLTEFEQRFFARSFQRMEAMETKLNQLSQLETKLNQLSQLDAKLSQLSQQVSQLNVVSQPPSHQPHVQPAPVPEAAPAAPPVEEDPLLSRLGAFIDDF